MNRYLKFYKEKEFFFSLLNFKYLFTVIYAIIDCLFFYDRI